MNDDLIKMKGIFQRGYGLISKAIMQDNELSIQAKGLYAYICSFSGKGNGVFPSRKKICTDLNISNDSLSKYVKELTDKQYIIVTQNKEEGKFANNIYNIIFSAPCPKISDTENSDTEIFVYDNLDTNNNNINNNSNNNIYSESLLELLEKNFCRTFNSIEIEEIMTWEDSDLTRYAIKKAVLNNKCNINYISKILYNYKKENIRSVADAIQQEEEFQKKKTANKLQTTSKRKEVIPEWFNKEIVSKEETEEEYKDIGEVLDFFSE